MDEATLTIRFRDETTGGPSGPGTTSPQGGGHSAGPNTAANTEAALANAVNSGRGSGSGASTPIQPVPPAGALPTPPAATAAPTGDPLLKTAQGIVSADPTVSIAEQQRALGIPKGRAEELLSAATIKPGGEQPAGAEAPKPQTVPSSGAMPVPPVNAPQSQPAPQFEIPRPPPLNLEQRLKEAESNPPPIPGAPSGPDQQTVNGVQSAVNSIAHLAHMGGPLGSAAAGAATAVMAIPGVPQALAAAMPSAAALAPWLGVAGAALAIPAATEATIRHIESQIGGLSPELAQAQAEALVRRIAADRRTSEMLGDEIADSVRNRSRISAGAQGFRDVAIEPLLQRYNDIQSAAASIAEKSSEAAQANKDIVQNATEFAIDSWLNQILSGSTFMLDIWRKIEQNTRKETPGSILNLDTTRPKLPYPFTNSDATTDASHDREVALPGLGF